MVQNARSAFGRVWTVAAIARAGGSRAGSGRAFASMTGLNHGLGGRLRLTAPRGASGAPSAAGGPASATTVVSASRGLNAGLGGATGVAGGKGFCGTAGPACGWTAASTSDAISGAAATDPLHAGSGAVPIETSSSIGSSLDGPGSAVSRVLAGASGAAADSIPPAGSSAGQGAIAGRISSLGGLRGGLLVGEARGAASATAVIGDSCPGCARGSTLSSRMPVPGSNCAGVASAATKRAGLRGDGLPNS